MPLTVTGAHGCAQTKTFKNSSQIPPKNLASKINYFLNYFEWLFIGEFWRSNQSNAVPQSMIRHQFSDCSNSDYFFSFSEGLVHFFALEDPFSDRSPSNNDFSLITCHYTLSMREKEKNFENGFIQQRSNSFRENFPRTNFCHFWNCHKNSIFFLMNNFNLFCLDRNQTTK